MMFTLTPYKKLYIFAALVISIGITFQNASANGTLAVPTFSQDWSDASLISANDDWSGVPSIIGYRGDALTAGIDTDPQTILAGDDAAPVVDVNANQTNPNTYTTGGVAEFEGVYQVVALQGSGTADAPYIKIFLNTTGMNNIHVTYNVRDIDGSADNAVQQVALHYRVGASGNFTNIPAGYIADATTGPGLAIFSTPVNVTLPSAANDQSHVELRIMTTNATGNDEWVGIDDISITANKAPTGFSLSPNSVLENKPIGTDVGTLTASDTAGDTHTFALVNSASCAGNGADNSNFTLVGNTLKTAAPFDYETKTSYVICVTVTDNNGLAFTGEHIVNIQDVSDETPVLVLYSSNTSPQNNSVVLTGPAQITIEFNKDVKNDSSSGAANNVANYLLVSEGANQTFDTKTCSGGFDANDQLIVINSASYSNNGGSGPFIAALNINNGTPLSAGKYQLLICGTTSIEDLAGNKLNAGTTDSLLSFTVSSVLTRSSSDVKTLLPLTGFPKGQVTVLPQQPADKTYASFSDLWLEIPKLTVSTPIVGVPLSVDGWDVSWLGKDAGWLNGTAFPG